MSEEQSTVDLRRYGAILGSRWGLIALVTVLGVLGAVAYLMVAPTRYVASTTVAVFAITSDPFAANRAANTLIDMPAEAVMASSASVAGAAADATGGWSSEELRDSTEVVTGSDSTTIRIRVQAATEQRARNGATAIAEAYLAAREARARSAIDTAVARNTAQVEALRAELTAAIARGADADPDSVESAEAEADRQLLDTQIAAVLARSSSLEGIDTTGGAVLDPASANRVSAEPSRQLVLMSGAALGLGLGVILAFALPVRRRRVRGDSDIKRILDTTPLGGWSAKRTAPAELEATAQRLLRAASLARTAAIAVVCDSRVPGSSDMVERLRHEVGAEGVSLVEVGPNAVQGDRLQALRECGATALVAVRGRTSVGALRSLMDDARTMGASVLGVMLVPDSPLRTDDGDKAGTRNLTSQT